MMAVDEMPLGLFHLLPYLFDLRRGGRGSAATKIGAQSLEPSHSEKDRDLCSVLLFKCRSFQDAFFVKLFESISKAQNPLSFYHAYWYRNCECISSHEANVSVSENLLYLLILLYL